MNDTAAVYANFKKTEASKRQVGGEHYRKLAIQPWDAMSAWLSQEEFKGFLRGNAIKYLARAGHKGSATLDFEKARHYLEKLIEVETAGVYPSTGFHAQNGTSAEEGTGRTELK
jgi:hypothetical protein